MAVDANKGKVARSASEAGEGASQIRHDTRTNNLTGGEPVAHFEVFETKGGEGGWRLVAANNEIVAQSEGYEGGIASAKRGVRDLIRAVADAQLAYGEPVIEEVEAKRR